MSDINSELIRTCTNSFEFVLSWLLNQFYESIFGVHPDNLVHGHYLPHNSAQVQEVDRVSGFQ